MNRVLKNVTSYKMFDILLKLFFSIPAIDGNMLSIISKRRFDMDYKPSWLGQFQSQFWLKIKVPFNSS